MVVKLTKALITIIVKLIHKNVNLRNCLTLTLKARKLFAKMQINVCDVSSTKQADVKTFGTPDLYANFQFVAFFFKLALEYIMQQRAANMQLYCYINSEENTQVRQPNVTETETDQTNTSGHNWNY